MQAASCFGLSSLWWLFVGLPLRLLLMLCIVLTAIVATENGLRVVVSVLPNLLHGQLHIGSVKGTLLGPLRVEQFRYTLNGVTVSIEETGIDWQWSSVFEGECHIDHLFVQGLHITLPPLEEDDTEPLVEVIFPFPITVQHGVMHDFRLLIPGVIPILIEETRLSAAIRKDIIAVQAVGKEGATTVHATGALSLKEYSLQFAGSWKNFAWPLKGKPVMESLQGEYRINGKVENYAFLVNGDLHVPNRPRSQWIIDAHGTDKALDATRLTVRGLNGSVEGTGHIAWSPTMLWRADLIGKNLEPAVHWPEVAGTFNAHLKNEGRFGASGLKTQAQLEDFSATIQGQTVKGRADIALQDDQWAIRTLQLEASGAQLRATGQVAEKVALQWDIQAPRLQTVLPTLRGALNSAGTLNGSREMPTIVGTVSLRDAAYGKAQVQQLRGEGRIDLSGITRSEWRSTGEELTIADQRWKTATLSLLGTPAAHDITLDATNSFGRFQMGLKGRLQPRDFSWQGQVSQWIAQNTPLGTWQLERPVALRATPSTMNLETACLKSAPTRLCAQGRWSAANGWHAEAQWFQLTPERFSTFLPRDWKIGTSTDGNVEFNGRSNSTWQGKFSSTWASGHVTHTTSKQPLQLTWKRSTIEGILQPTSLNIQATVDASPLLTAKTTVRLQPPWNEPRMSGDVKAILPDVSGLSALVPQLQKVSGQLNADITITGTVKKPLVRGDIRLENARATIPEAGITLESVRATATSSGKGPVQLTGHARLGAGTLEWSGIADPQKSTLNLQVQGRDLQALNTSTAQLSVSPNLRVDMMGQQIYLTGEVAIPKAVIRPNGAGQNAIKPSQDVVIVSQKGVQKEAPPDTKGINLHAKVRVVLGEDVEVETPAFKGKVTGMLLVEETPQLAPRGSGSIQVVAGNYKVYGEPVRIEHGQFLFSGNPLDNPGLDLRVTRQSPGTSAMGSNSQITAGANIQGTLKSPKLTLFSDPKMPSSNILSYLVLGRNSTGAESAVLFKAANAMGLGGSGLQNNLRDAFGLDALELASVSGDKNDTALMLGKYLSPDLYVGYGVGLFNAANTFTVKYRLNQWLQFESSSNATGTGGDVTYTVEH